MEREHVSTYMAVPRVAWSMKRASLSPRTCATAVSLGSAMVIRDGVETCMCRYEAQQKYCAGLVFSRRIATGCLFVVSAVSIASHDPTSARVQRRWHLLS